MTLLAFARAFTTTTTRTVRISHHHAAFGLTTTTTNKVCMSASASASAITDTSNTEEESKTPITLLSGFLGSGKTSTLLNILENKEGLRVGVIVNDVASVNIDAKLVATGGNNATSDKAAGSSRDDVTVMNGDDTVELQNGCACCSLADELLDSVQNLMTGRKFDSIVVELSGVADPVAVRDNWKLAMEKGHAATSLADVSRVVTVVDGATFGTDWMTWDTAGDRNQWVDEGDDCAGQRKVPELLAEQIEAADVLLINKADIAGEDQVKTASSLASVLNEKAALFESKFGRVPLRDVLGLAEEKAVLIAADVDADTNSTVATVSDVAEDLTEEVVDEKESSDGHSHDHEHAVCDAPDCTDPTHDHSHSHDHDDDDDGDAKSCDDPKCTDPTHDHSHSHDHACDDPTCTDPTHDHSHSHDHASTSTDNLGISSFVYKQEKPFNAHRLLVILNTWPVPIKNTLDVGEIKAAVKDGAQMGDDKVQQSPFVGVLRSKGFCWIAPDRWMGVAQDAWRHDTAMYWSHAGKHFGINTAGKWWGSITKDQMKAYFANNIPEYDRIMREDWVSDEWGDRRQEIVFIGVNLDEDAIRAALDECICTEKEMEVYSQQLRNLIEASFSAQAIDPDGPSLFDETGNDHLDVGDK
eukprot:CAMPEP_0116012450 /NCGR_PEP_ID=MMETSP0321-20121206/5135_1 /TAXON_ID=163516 /ORGANISM="Leptocylindrus danicus var. danicus, Strain B650" /LENGTH=640 /DNA_ID=CAMNT_0003481805 /DNA_START=13 /DNA_END=1935 /DNA_ORIENTATION=-